MKRRERAACRPLWIHLVPILRIPEKVLKPWEISTRAKRHARWLPTMCLIIPRERAQQFVSSGNPGGRVAFFASGGLLTSDKALGWDSMSGTLSVPRLRATEVICISLMRVFSLDPRFARGFGVHERWGSCFHRFSSTRWLGQRRWFSIFLEGVQSG